MVNMGNVWDRTSEFLSENMSALLPIALVALLVPHSITALTGGAGTAINPFAGYAISLACVLIALWGQLAIVALALVPDGGRPRAAAVATGSFGRALAAMLLLFLVIALIAAPMLSVLAGGGMNLAQLGGGGMADISLSTGAKTFVSIYALILSALVFYVSIRLVMLYPVIVAEGGVIDALRRAFALSRGIVWKLIGVWVLFIIVYLVGRLAVTSAVGAIVALLSSSTSPFAFGKILVAILSGLVTTIYTVIVAAFSAKLYRAVVAAREGMAPTT